MPNYKNEYFVGRTAKASFTISNGAKTNSTGVIIPKGAIVTGARIVAPNAITIAAASGTVQIRVGGVNIVATSNISTLAAVTVPRILTMATTAGNYLTINSEIQIIEGTTNNASATASYDVYVDYIYA